MKKKSIAILIAIFITFSALSLIPITTTADDSDFLTTFPRNNMAPEGLDPMDLSPEMLGKDEMALRELAGEVGAAEATKALPFGGLVLIDDEITIWVSDDGQGIDYQQTFHLYAEGEHGIIMIQKEAWDNPVSDGFLFPDPLSGGHFISSGQLDYLLDQLDTVIYPSNTEIFGQHLPRGDKGQKVWTFIFNIRDDSYYDPTVGSYIAGYFSAGTNAENNMNIIHIDTYDWANRVGPDVARPYLYEGVIAHEFEHLIHFDQDPDEPSWVDEGLADMAGFFCGYGHSESHVAYYMVYHPFTALTFWGGGLEDYGACYLFQLYLYEKFGGAAFSSALVQEQANGIEGIENTLAAFGHRESFDEIFDAWTIANYIDDPKKAGGKYGYETIELGSIDSWGYSIEYALSNFWWGPPDEVPFGLPSYWLGDPQPYTAQYYRFYNQKTATVIIDADDFSGTLPYSGEYEWYSDAEAWAWRSFYQSFEIPSGGATLEFYTYYDIEGDWDYGYVEVYDQDTTEWYTLYAPGTVDYVAHPQDNPNTPDGREPYDYEDAGRWHAFTGFSGGWIPVSMDLTPFAGHTIDLYFRTWQDGAFTLQMMWVDDISIPEIGFYDGVETGEDGWTSEGWYISNGMFDNGYSVTVIDTKWVPTERYPEPLGNSAMELHSIHTLTVDPLTQSGTMKVSSTPFNSGRTKVAIVTNHADHILPSYYELYVV